MYGNVCSEVAIEINCQQLVIVVLLSRLVDGTYKQKQQSMNSIKGCSVQTIFVLVFIIPRTYD